MSEEAELERRRQPAPGEDPELERRTPQAGGYDHRLERRKPQSSDHDPGLERRQPQASGHDAGLDRRQPQSKFSVWERTIPPRPAGQPSVWERTIPARPPAPQKPAGNRPVPPAPTSQNAGWNRAMPPAPVGQNSGWNRTIPPAPAVQRSAWERTVPRPAIGQPSVWDRTVPAPGSHPPSHRQRSRRRRFVIGTALTAVVVAAAAITLVATAFKGGSPGTLPIATLADGSPLAGGVTSIAFDPSLGAETLATGDVDGNVYLWNFENQRPGAKLTPPPPPAGTFASSQSISSVAFSPDGSKLAIGYNNGEVALWSVATEKELRTLTCPPSLTGGVSSVAFSPNSGLLAAGDGNGNTYLFDVATGHPMSFLKAPGSELVSSLAFSKNGALAVGDNNGTIYVWNLANDHVVETLIGSRGNGAGISAVAFSPDGVTLAAAGREGAITLWDTNTQHQRAVLTEPDGKLVNSVAFSPINGQMLASGDGNGHAYLFNVATGNMESEMKDPGASIGGVASVAFSPNGQALATGDGDDSTYLWAP